MFAFQRFLALAERARQLETQIDRNLLLQAAVAVVALLYIADSSFAEALAENLGITRRLIQVITPIATVLLFLQLAYAGYRYLEVRQLMRGEARRLYGTGREAVTALEKGYSLASFVYGILSDAASNSSVSTEVRHPDIDFGEPVPIGWRDGLKAVRSLPGDTVSLLSTKGGLLSVTAGLTFAAPVVVNISFSAFFSFGSIEWGFFPHASTILLCLIVISLLTFALVVIIRYAQSLEPRVRVQITVTVAFTFIAVFGISVGLTIAGPDDDPRPVVTCDCGTVTPTLSATTTVELTTTVTGTPGSPTSQTPGRPTSTPTSETPAAPSDTPTSTPTSETPGMPTDTPTPQPPIETPSPTPTSCHDGGGAAEPPDTPIPVGMPCTGGGR